MKNFLQTAIIAAIKAGNEILEVYNTEFAVETKEDDSPLTLADKKSNDVIVHHLTNTGIPILSEEGIEIPFSERKNWNQLWIVDPLDGTKEFIKRNGEFTVNIAFVRNHFPVLGVIYVPVSKQLYFASTEHGAFMATSDDVMDSPNWLDELISNSKKLPYQPSAPNEIRIVASRSHMSPETEQFIADQEKQFEKVELVSMGSSLKICLVAEGKADVYPRFAPTMEWDTAAGQAIAECAGRTFIDYKLGERMAYNRENLRNNWFLVS